MSGRRLPALRLARIGAWTAAALTWAASFVADVEMPKAAEIAISPDAANQQSGTVLSALPTQPESGLLVVRYTPTQPPPPEVIERNVVVTRPAPAAPVAPAPAPAPEPLVVESNGS